MSDNKDMLKRVVTMVLNPLNDYDLYLASKGVSKEHASRKNFGIACHNVVGNLDAFLTFTGDELDPVDEWIKSKTSPAELTKAVAECRRRLVASKAIGLARAESIVEHQLAAIMLQVRQDITAGLTDILEADDKDREAKIKALLNQQGAGEQCTKK